MIKVENLCVELGDFVLWDASLEVPQGEYFIILGPTGAGKTVLLETIAGLYPAKSGKIWIEDREVTHLAPEKRGIGFVYQDHVLFPHLSVMGNIAFGPRQRRNSKGRIEADAKWAIDLLRGGS